MKIVCTGECFYVIIQTDEVIFEKAFMGIIVSLTLLSIIYDSFMSVNARAIKNFLCIRIFVQCFVAKVWIEFGWHWWFLWWASKMWKISQITLRHLIIGVEKLICFIQRLILLFPNALKSVKFGQLCQFCWSHKNSSQSKLKEKLKFAKIHIGKLWFSAANVICIKIYSDLRS